MDMYQAEAREKREAIRREEKLIKDRLDKYRKIKEQ
jgi:hypothetical protein